MRSATMDMIGQQTKSEADQLSLIQCGVKHSLMGKSYVKTLALIPVTKTINRPSPFQNAK
jgi:hypothetical protein